MYISVSLFEKTLTRIFREATTKLVVPIGCGFIRYDLVPGGGYDYEFGYGLTNFRLCTLKRYFEDMYARHVREGLVDASEPCVWRDIKVSLTVKDDLDSDQHAKTHLLIEGVFVPETASEHLAPVADKPHRVVVSEEQHGS